VITWAVVPVKPLIRAKSRLADVLTPKERENLSLKMLVRVLETLKTADVITNVLVISRDTHVLAVARDIGVHTVQESGQPELNSALTRATSLLQSWGVEATLILPADLPLLSKEDVAAMIQLGRYNGTVVISPDANLEGTNAMLLHPPALIPYSYGSGSFHRHIQSAKSADAIVHIYESERLRVDVDTPNDLMNYQALATKLGETPLDYTRPLKELTLISGVEPNG
jgi:2-phospho-L-lactate/phosphoenolpyruvate guanylyltransferase